MCVFKKLRNQPYLANPSLEGVRFDEGLALESQIYISTQLTLQVWCDFRFWLCIGQIEASTNPPGKPRAFDTFAVLGRREFDYQSLPGGGEFDPHALGVGNLNCTLDFM